MNREYHRWYSERTQRDMELLVFGHAGAKVLVFPTRDGRFYEYENLRLVKAVKHKIDAGHLQLFCVDSIDFESFYAYWKHPAERLRTHQRFEHYIIHEVLPFMHNKNSHHCTISHGCSLGAFHAVNIALRHPHLFQKLVAFSGRYDLTISVDCFHNLFDGYYDDSIYFHTPSHYLPNLDDEWQLNQIREMDIVLTIGKQDPFLQNNRHLSETLWQKGAWHAFHEWDDRAHSGYYWRRMAPLYL